MTEPIWTRAAGNKLYKKRFKKNINCKSHRIKKPISAMNWNHLTHLVPCTFKRNGRCAFLNDWNDCDTTNQSKCPKNTKSTTVSNIRDFQNEIHDANSHNETIKYVPTALQVSTRTKRYQFHYHLQEKHERKNLFRKDVSFANMSNIGRLKVTYKDVF